MDSSVLIVDVSTGHPNEGLTLCRGRTSIFERLKFSDIHNPKAAAEAIRAFQKQFSAKVCLSPQGDCSGSIVSAHTLSASSMLRPISRNGNVYSLRFDLFNSPSENTASLTLRGISDTSVFNGFCAKHDTALFSPIENKPFMCSPEQVFLHGYRAVCKEAYLKRKQAEGLLPIEKFKEIHGIEGDVEFSPDAVLLQAGSLKGAQEIEAFKSRLDRLLLTSDFRRLVTTIVPFEISPKITASFVYAPDFDFEGNYLQDFENMERPLSHLIVTLLPSTEGGFLLLSHEDTANSAPQRLIDSLVARTDLTSATVWLIACQTENFAISPDWYEGLHGDLRMAFQTAFHSNTDPFHSSFNQLSKLKVVFDDWNAGKPFTI